MNLAYKHLEAKLRIGELTILQWFGVFVGVMLAIGWGMYISPFGPTISMITAIYLGGLPIAAVFIASFSDFDLWLVARAAITWMRSDDRYLPGPGDTATGYVLHADPAEVRRNTRTETRDLDLASLWES